VCLASGNEPHSAAGSADEDGELGDLASCRLRFDFVEQQTLNCQGERDASSQGEPTNQLTNQL